MLQRLLLAAAFLITAAAAEAQDRSRLDPLLRFPILREPETSPDRPAEARPKAGIMAAATESPAGPELSALLWLRPGAEADLDRLGVRLGTRAGDVATARIPLARLHDVMALRSVAYVQASRPLSAPAFMPPALAAADAAPAVATAMVTNDVETGAGSVRRRSGGAWRGLTGRSVIVGIYDTGLDLSHADFLDDDGRSRVLYAWDQTQPAGTPPGQLAGHDFAYGHECTAASITARSCPMIDRHGHGTHVTGVAAGNGAATGAGRPAHRFPGIAPEAELVIVKGGDGVFTWPQVLDGVAYIFARAAELGMPAVVNLSLNGQAGPHDGTTLLERGLDALTGPGRVIVGVAGNEGVNGNEEPEFIRAPIHASGRPAPGTALSHELVLPIYAPWPGPNNDGAYLELWYDGTDAFTITVRSPAGDAVTASTGEIDTIFTPRGAIGVSNGFGGPEALNGDHLAIVVVGDVAEAGGPQAGEPESGSWTITVQYDGGTGSGRYHLWLAASSFRTTLQPVRLRGGTSNSHLVGVPGTAAGLITVGAYASRHAWLGQGGVERHFQFQEPLGDIAFFSSPGPRRDGVLKPDLAAPGKVIVSSRSSLAAQWTGLEWLIEEDGVHAGLLGTSMAAPQVAGAIALLMELDRQLTPDRARALLIGSARSDSWSSHSHDGQPDAVPNAQWGHGKLDVSHAARLLDSGAARPARRASLSANPVRTGSVVIGYAERPRTVTIYTFAGERVRAFASGEVGDRGVTWDLRNDAGRPVANGAYVLILTYGGETVREKLFVARR
jgi:subtilisin family serine protease